MSNFSETLAELLADKQLTIKTFADKIGVNATCITNYLHDTRTPSVKILIKIADYFNCSTDFILGRDIERQNLTFKKCPPFSERLPVIMEQNGFYPQKLFNETGIKKSRFYDWKSGKRQPSLDNIIKLADKFGCSVDYVLGRE